MILSQVLNNSVYIYIQISIIYLQYLAGASFKQLAERLQTEDVPYDVDKPWNKNMVARILEDDRYVGEKYFPALIPTEQFHAAQERRKEMHPEYKQTSAQKELRKLCGGIVPDSVAPVSLIESLIRLRKTLRFCQGLPY